MILINVGQFKMSAWRADMTRCSSDDITDRFHLNDVYMNIVD